MYSMSYCETYLLWVMAKKLKKTGLYQGLGNFFCKGPGGSKYFRLCELRGYVRSLLELLN